MASHTWRHVLIRNRADRDHRIARDGFPYTRSEFQEFYANRAQSSRAWENAFLMNRAAEPPPGLGRAHVDKSFTDGALAEIMPRLPRSSPACYPNVLEVGWSYFNADCQDLGTNQWCPTTISGPPLSDFPCLRQLINCVMHELDGPTWALPTEKLNVICTLYGVGEGITMHVDTIDLFEENVYGCILRNTSDRVLEFHKMARADDSVHHCYIPKEVPGTCFVLGGSARYEWTHGVAPLRFGERISVTWRSFHSHAVCRQHARVADA